MQAVNSLRIILIVNRIVNYCFNPINKQGQTDRTIEPCSAMG